MNKKVQKVGNLRAAAAQVISNVVIKGRSLSDSLSTISAEFKDPRDQALLHALCYGVCRWYFRLDAIAKCFLEKPLKQKDQDIYALLLVGLYQLIDMRVPEYAAVTETVVATQWFKKPWAKGLLNGILRQYLRNKTSEFSGEVALYSHPLWMIEKIQNDYPDHWQQVLEANNQHPPFALRVNQRLLTREEYLVKYPHPELDFRAIPETRSGIILKNAIDVVQLPGFAEGEISVQDGAAQLAAELLELQPHHRVLDACAAPGGKTTHILEREPTVTCVAVDQDDERLISVKENLERLKLSAHCVAADVSDVQQWWDGQLFDRILLDAPCSASGVIRRHPDIKLLRRASDIAQLVETQLRLLNAVWNLLKPDGLLLYSTCSIFQEENTEVLQRFLAQHPEAREDKIKQTFGTECVIGRQILPGMHDMDGFYYARLRK